MVIAYGLSGIKALDVNSGFLDLVGKCPELRWWIYEFSGTPAQCAKVFLSLPGLPARFHAMKARSDHIGAASGTKIAGL